MNGLSRISLALLIASGLSACAGLPAASISLPGTKTSSAKTLTNSKKTTQTAGKTNPNSGSETTQTENEITTVTTTSAQVVDNDLWERLPRGFKINASSRQPQVQAQIAWFMQHQDYLNRTTTRAAPYMYYIVQRIEERNLPAELALLPIIESAYYPLAHSGVGATGLWQLMPGTASKFGLKQNLWYDGRRDIFASTNAALDYFTYLENYFDGNWLLAIAAYDAGEGTIQEAVRRNAMQGRATDFWALNLPAETMSYVPRLLALAEIIRHRNHYGIQLPPINDRPYLAQVNVNQPLTLALAAHITGMSLAELKQLNPGYKREPHAPYRLTLPIDKVAVFKEQLEPKDKDAENDEAITPTDQAEATTNSATANSTETPVSTELANTEQNTNTAVVPIANSEKGTADTTTEESDKNTVADDESTDTDTDSDVPPTAIKRVAHQLHTVKAGDTLFKIAKRYHVSVKQLQQWNKLKESQAIKPGSKLIVNQTSQTSESQPAEETLVVNKAHIPKSTTNTRSASHPSSKHSQPSAHSYTVKAGDTLTSIAKHFDVKVPTLQKLNHLVDSSLHPGQKLSIQ